jgi:hypothetical protein
VLRHQRFARATKFRDSTVEKTEQKLARYKDLYGRHVRKRDGSIQIGDSVFVRTHVLEPALSPKLSSPWQAPTLSIVGIAGSNVDINTLEGQQRI